MPPKYDSKSVECHFARLISPRPLETLCKNIFQETGLTQTLTNIVLPVYEAPTEKTYFFSTKKASELSKDLKLRDVIVAANSSPYFLKPKVIMDRKFIDGLSLGCYSANFPGSTTYSNPTLKAYHMATALGFKSKHIFILSVGTGTDMLLTRSNSIQLSKKARNLSRTCSGQADTDLFPIRPQIIKNSPISIANILKTITESN